MPVEWLKIGLNLAEKITLLSLRIPLEVYLEIKFYSPLTNYCNLVEGGMQLWSIVIT